MLNPHSTANSRFSWFRGSNSTTITATDIVAIAESLQASPWVLNRLKALGVCVEKPFSVGASCGSKRLLFIHGYDSEQFEGNLFRRIFADVNDRRVCHFGSP